MSINVGGGELKELKPRILVMGVGGAGGNAINAMMINIHPLITANRCFLNLHQTNFQFGATSIASDSSF